MFIKKILLSIGFVLFGISLFSQVKIEGDMRLGDTTQVHILITKNGDRMIGRVAGFDEKNIQFLMLGNKLTFTIEEVEKILVERTASDISDTVSRRNIPPFLFKVIEDSGDTYEGELIGYAHGTIVMQNGDGKRSFKTSDVNQLWFMDEQNTEHDLNQQYYRLTKKNGEKVKGQVLAFENRTWGFRNMEGKEFSISKSNVQLIELMVREQSTQWERSVLNLSDDFLNRPNFTKNFVAPTGFLLKRGQGEYRNTEIIFNNVEYGISDYVNVGVGFSSILLVNGISGKIKIGTSITNMLHVAAGGQAAYAFGSDINSDPVSVYYGAFTCGTQRNHLTISLGRVNGADDDTYSSVTLAGAIQAGQRFGFFAEYNRVIEVDYDNTLLLFNLGASWYKKSDRFDFGFTIIGEEDNYVPFPIAAYSYYF